MPLLASLSLALAAMPVAPAVTLSRGGPGDAAFRYWAVEDTFLDSKAPDENYGRDALLTAGPGKTVLIRFGDLERMVPAGKKIAQARIVLRKEIGSDPKLKAALQLLQSWGEGPGRRGLFAKLESKAKGEEPRPYGPPFAATWRHRHSGPSEAAGWQSGGGSGINDARPIAEAKIVDGVEDCAIEGLGRTLEWMRTHPYDNHGIALQFSTNVDFASSDAAHGRPRLELELADSQVPGGADLAVESIEPLGEAPRDGMAVVWNARIRNVGDQGAAAFRYEWSADGRTLELGHIDQALEPGATVQASITLPFRRKTADHRLDPLRLRVVPEGADASTANDVLEVPRSGLAVQAPVAGPNAEPDAKRKGFRSFNHYIQWAVRFWNETLLTQSRFSFARDGSKERVRLVQSGPGQDISDPFDLNTLMREWSRSIGLRDLSSEEIGPKQNPIVVEGVQVHRSSPSLYPGLMGGGDTRDEGEYLPQLPIPTEPWPDELLDQTHMPATDLYASADLARLDALLDVAPEARSGTPDAWPKTVLVKFVNSAGLSLPNAEIDVLTPVLGGEFVKRFVLKTSGHGSAVLPDVAADQPSILLFRASLGSTTEYGWLKASQILTAARRASAAATILDVRVPLPALPIDPKQNLALNRIVSDGVDSYPAKLAPLVDGDDSTVCEIALNSQWIELDLGRDRPIGEVQLQVVGDTVWPQFDIRIHQTGQRPSEALRYASERYGAWTLSNRFATVPGAPDARTLVYRGPGYKARYLRLVSINALQPVRLAEIRVVPFATEPQS